MNFTNQHHFEKFVHKGLSLAIYLKSSISGLLANSSQCSKNAIREHLQKRKGKEFEWGLRQNSSQMDIFLFSFLIANT